MEILLISKTPIVIQIFKLISKKLDVELEIQDDIDIEGSYDIIVVDQEFIDAEFNTLKPLCIKLGAISSKELSFDKMRDFLVTRPFLPMQLQKIITEEIKEVEKIKKEREKEQVVEKVEEKQPLSKEAEYVKSLAENIADGIDDIDEEFEVDNFNEEGGVLDNQEISKIKNILGSNALEAQSLETVESNSDRDNDDFADLADIIDRSLDDFSEADLYGDEDEEEQSSSEGEMVFPICLNNHTIEDVKPFLKKLDKNILGLVGSGKRVKLELYLKETQDD